MAQASLEERLVAIETELAPIKRTLQQEHSTAQPQPWWEAHFGAFANSAEFEKALELGRKHRRASVPIAWVWSISFEFVGKRFTQLCFPQGECFCHQFLFDFGYNHRS